MAPTARPTSIARPPIAGTPTSAASARTTRAAISPGGSARRTWNVPPPATAMTRPAGAIATKSTPRGTARPASPPTSGSAWPRTAPPSSRPAAPESPRAAPLGPARVLEPRFPNAACTTGGSTRQRRRAVLETGRRRWRSGPVGSSRGFSAPSDVHGLGTGRLLRCPG